MCHWLLIEEYISIHVQLLGNLFLFTRETVFWSELLNDTVVSVLQQNPMKRLLGKHS